MTRAQYDLNTNSPLNAREVYQVLRDASRGIRTIQTTLATARGYSRPICARCAPRDRARPDGGVHAPERASVPVSMQPPPEAVVGKIRLHRRLTRPCHSRPGQHTLRYSPARPLLVRLLLDR
ncbi:hypothetical protein D3C80_963860 [compost metagenome]